MTHVVVLADTHIRRGGTGDSGLGTGRARRPGRALGRLPEAAYPHLEAADVILHAGDVLVGEVLDELAGFAPVHAVLGNNDAELAGALPATRSIEIDGVRIAMVHDSGPAAGRARRLHRRFPEADVVVFGHSHIPWHDSGVDGQLLFNPGSPTERRAQPSRTLGTLDLEAGRIAGSRIHVLG